MFEAFRPLLVFGQFGLQDLTRTKGESALAATGECHKVKEDETLGVPGHFRTAFMEVPE